MGAHPAPGLALFQRIRFRTSMSDFGKMGGHEPT